MLTDSKLSGGTVADMANLGWWLGEDTTFFPGQGGPPSNQVEQIRLINHLADENGISLGLSAKAMKGTTGDLIDLLGQPDKVAIVTIQWEKGDPRRGHAMVLAAYDPTRVNREGDVTPWGFINPAGGVSAPYLDWRTDAEFQEIWENWGTLGPFDITFALGGNYNMVVVSSSYSPSTSPTRRPHGLR